MQVTKTQTEGFEISPQQTRLWEISSENRNLYRVGASVEIDGEIDANALKNAVKSIFLRHEILRTALRSEKHLVKPLQVITDKTATILRFDASAFSEAEIENLCVEIKNRPFNLENAETSHWSLIKISDRRHLLLFVISAFCADAESVNILVSEIFALYEDSSAKLAESLQYADLSRWQLDLLAEEGSGKSYWRKLACETGSQKAEFLKYDSSLKFKKSEIALGKDVELKIADYLKVRKIAAESFWLAGWTILLARMTGEEKIALGVKSSGRSYEDLQFAVGNLTKFLPFSGEVQTNENFSQILLKTDENLREGRDWHEFFSAVELTDFRPQYGFDFSESKEKIRLNDTEIELKKIFGMTENFELLFGFQQNTPFLQYQTSTFENSEIKRIGERLKTIIGQIIETENAAIGDLNLVGETERAVIINDFNRTEVEFSAKLLPEIFGEAAAKFADKCAVEIGSETISYRELDAQSNRLANFLTERGAGAETMIGISHERSIEMIVGILAILKSGAAFVPIDSNYPQERLDFLVKDAKTNFLLLRESSVAAFEKTESEKILLDGANAEWREFSAMLPARKIQPETAAYVIYTSGTTGKPKGVMVSHRSIANHLNWRQEEFGFTSEDSFLQKAALSFDIAIWEIFTPLISGGKLVLAQPEGEKDFAYLASAIADKQITFAHFSPFQLRRFLNENTSDCRALRKVFAGGERLTDELKNAFYRKFDAELVQQYGPTETTVDVTFWNCRRDANGALPIGKPIANTKAFVLDERLQILPIGTIGELYIGGDALARGYLGKAALTAEKFIPNPFSDSGERLYQTGDLASFDANGNLYFAGRADRQLKVRGYRIEPDEIEKNLRQFSEIGDAIVTVFDESENEQKIAAYFTTGNDELKSSTLRDFLRTKLPEYAVPSAYIRLDEIPLNRNGKTDFAALPAPQDVQKGEKREVVAPRDETEKMLAEIWREVLNVETVGVRDNFFDLGGDSIRSVQVVAKIRKQNWHVELKDLFEFQTIEQLARKVVLSQAKNVKKIEPFELVPENDRNKLPPNLTDAYPLTLLQSGMLFHGELEADSNLYHNVAGVHLRLPFAGENLHRAIDILTEKHAVLRTSFDLHNYSEPLQLVHEKAQISLDIHDLREMHDEEQNIHLEKWIEAEKERKFDWTKPPLIRFTVHLRSAESFQFSRTEHHAILDGWSVASMLTELFGIYRQLLANEEISATPSAETSFREFVALEKEALKDENQISFWRDFLADATVSRVPRLPSFLEREPNGRRGEISPIAVCDALSAKLKETAATLGVQVKHLLLAAHLRVLACLSGQTDVVSGLISNGRPENIGSENVLGLFLNTLPLRQKLKSGESWRDLIRRTFEIEREMLPFRRFPLAEMQRISGEQLFEAAFNFVSFHVYENIHRADFAEILAEQSFQETNFIFLATASVNPQSGKINFRLEYDAAQFTAEQIENILGYYAKSLEAIAFRADENYLDAIVLDERETHLVARKWNDTAAAYSQTTAIHQFFEEQAIRTPNNVAAVFGKQKTSYRELNEEANRIANLLIDLGLERGELVGVHLKRSMEMIPALLAILKIGCAYVPLEISNPHERVRNLIAHHKIRALLTESERIGDLFDETGALKELQFVVCLDEGAINGESFADYSARIISREDFQHFSAENPQIEVDADDLAYIIFTSGSTGLPKGVMVAHKPVINLIEWITKTHGIGANDRVLFITSLSFDLSVYDIFGFLAVGGSIRIASQEEIAEPAELYRILRDEPITFWDSAPAAMQQIVPFFEENCETAPTLRLVYFSGDWIPVTLPDNVRRAFPKAEIIALGGATEATVWSNFYPVGAVDPRWASIPYGKPIQNAEYRVLDERLLPAPIGTVGDLYIGGEVLAMGYLDEPILTATKFIPDPFAEKTGAIIYRTGDRARFFPDGNIEFMGRIDHQVKIRGYRVELGEIEATLLKISEIRQAIVLAQINERKEKFLAAYVVFKNAPGEIPENDLRMKLRESLPEYMIPAAFVYLAEIPVTSNGKVDRKALPMPNEKTSNENRSIDAPNNEIERILAGIWAEVLGVETVSRSDDFFMLGGHSLLATQVVSRLREVFNLELPLRRLFEQTTLEKLAREIDLRLKNKETNEIIVISRTEKTEIIPLSFAQQRLYFMQMLNPQNTAFHIPLGLRLKGNLSVERLEKSLREIIKRHEILRTSFHNQSGKLTQKINENANDFFVEVTQVDDVSAAEKEKRALKILRERLTKPFNLAESPLMRAVLIELDADEYIAFLVMHHTISDGWSLGILIRELAEFYRSFGENSAAVLPEMNIQYADFAVWQRNWAETPDYRKQIDYWKNHLGGTSTEIEFPFANERPPKQSFRGEKIKFEIQPELAAKLKSLSRRENATLYMTLLAAFNALIFQYTKQTDIVIGADMANRNRRETENLIGFFVNLTVMRTTVSADESFTELLKKIRTNALEAYSNQDIPFEKIVEELKIKRSLDRNPLFQTLFVLQNAPFEDLKLPNLKIEPVELEAETVQFDLILSMTEKKDSIKGDFTFATDLFNRRDIEKMTTDFQKLLTAIAENPGAAIADLQTK